MEASHISPEILIQEVTYTLTSYYLQKLLKMPLKHLTFSILPHFLFPQTLLPLSQSPGSNLFKIFWGERSEIIPHTYSKERPETQIDKGVEERGAHSLLVRM